MVATSARNREGFGLDGRKRMKKFVLAAVLAAGMPLAAHAQDVDAGKAAFAVCKACHAIGEGAKNQIGPVLNGVVGRKSGSIPDFNYSEGMKALNVTWDEANLTEWITNPKAKVAGTKMIFAGIKDPEKVKNIIAYLNTFGPDGKPK